MKKSLNYLGFIVLIFISIYSCETDSDDNDVYYELSDEAKDFLLFDTEDTFNLRNLITDQVITLKILSKDFTFIEAEAEEEEEESSTNVFIERGEYSFSDSLDCFTGTFTLTADTEGGFEFKAALGQCFGNSNYLHEGDFFPTIDIQGVDYPNAYVLKSSPNFLYYSKEKGILKIVDNTNNVSLFSYVE